MSRIADEILKAVGEEAQRDARTITPATRLEDLLDSVGRLLLVMRLEQDYALEISDADLERLLVDGTVGGVIAYAEARLGESGGSHGNAKTEGHR
jgi:acyl carrier protein